MPHGQRRRAQEVGFVHEAARLSQSQVGLMNECRGLQRVAATQPRSGAMRDPPQLL